MLVFDLVVWGFFGDDYVVCVIFFVVCCGCVYDFCFGV